MMKYVQSEIISVIDAIIGPAIRAGSMPIFFATIGKHRSDQFGYDDYEDHRAAYC